MWARIKSAKIHPAPRTSSLSVTGNGQEHRPPSVDVCVGEELQRRSRTGAALFIYEVIYSSDRRAEEEPGHLLSLANEQHEQV